jgi:transcriptional regulator with XRE-family HTH domain
MNQIGSRLRKLREQKGLTQSDIAKIMGKSQRMISKYEKQESELDYITLLKYAAYFNVTTDSLLGRVNNQNEFLVYNNEFPDVLKPLLMTPARAVIKADEPNKLFTNEEKKQYMEEKLKKIIVDINDIESLTTICSFLPEKDKKPQMSLYELFQKVGNNINKLRLDDILADFANSDLPPEALKELDDFRKYLITKYKK